METWWEKIESMCKSWNQEREERHRFWAERDGAHERYIAEQAVRHEAEQQAAAAAEEREAAAAAERERAAAEAEKDAAEKPEQLATITVFFDSSKAFSFGFLNESSVLPKISTVVPQIDTVLFQIDVVLQTGNFKFDVASRPPPQPPDLFLCSGDLYQIGDLGFDRFVWHQMGSCVLIDLFQIDDVGFTELFQLSNSRLLDVDSPQHGGDIRLGGVVFSLVKEFAFDGR